LLAAFVSRPTAQLYSNYWRDAFTDPETKFHERMQNTPLPSTPFGDDFEPRRKK